MHKDKTEYTPPSEILAKHPKIDVKSCLEWVDLAEGAPSNYFAQVLHELDKVPKTIKAAFHTGAQIEIIHPRTKNSIERALITESNHDDFFRVQLLDDPETPQVVRHCLSSDILPFGWSESLASKMRTVKNLDHDGKKVPSKCFHNYVTKDAKEFSCGNKLEVKLQNGEFHTGNIIETKDHILVIDLDSDEKDEKDLYIAPSNSMDLYPIGWSQTNNLPTMLPTSFLKELNTIVSKTLQESKSSETKNVLDNQICNNEQTNSWCPKIYFNYKCYSASFLSKARLACLPRSVGPGTVRLVMREVISLLVGSSYKSGSILKRLECFNEVPRKDFVIDEIKGKSRVLNLKANIEIPTRTYQVEKMCKDVCQKVGACPHLVSMHRYLSDDGCPADCQNRPKANFIVNEDDNSYMENSGNGNSQNGYQKSLLSGYNPNQGMGIKRRRDGRRKKRTNPDRLLIAEHIQLKRQKNKDQMGSEVNSSCEVSSGGSDMDDEETVPTSLASTTASSLAASRSNSPNGQMFVLDRDDGSRLDRKNKKGRGRKEWER